MGENMTPEARNAASELFRRRPELLDALATVRAHFEEMPPAQRELMLATLGDTHFTSFYNGYVVCKFGVKPTEPHPFDRYMSPSLRNKRA